jgi:hypothetical protein
MAVKINISFLVMTPRSLSTLYEHSEKYTTSTRTLEDASMDKSRFLKKFGT